ncbi:alcohol dehydrogenase catalytic domain-containing protein [Nannocystis punicea]|uniref:Alcohol dehydrogenase catalytic domain-containing protein n=1 Tax=Nannocystis punicea TaxID=2995304 RepID=A0ABY7HJS1_9BACT|nr:alcohol dehydrogenase catalytic domain-containing protein [Nannocystis poenicansa]
MKTAAYAATAADRPLAPFTLERREPGPRDVVIDILHCGLCHSDIMQTRNQLGRSRYPMVPGHEIVGRVARVGADVARVKAGDISSAASTGDSSACLRATTARAHERQPARARARRRERAQESCSTRRMNASRIADTSLARWRWAQ